MRSIVVVTLVLLWPFAILAAPNDKIGPSIGEELQAAGVAGLPFAWNSQIGQVRTDDPRLTEAQRAAILAVFAAHDPNKLSSGQQVEQAKIKAKADFIAQCTDIESDMAISIKIKQLCKLLRQILP